MFDKTMEFLVSPGYDTMLRKLGSHKVDPEILASKSQSSKGNKGKDKNK